MSENPEHQADLSESSDSSGEEDDMLVDHGAFFRYVLRSMALQRHIAAQTNEELVRNLQRSEALKTPKIIEAFSILPRAEFLLPDMLDEAYNDHPLRFATMGFNISAPHMYAMCLENLQIEEGNSFLDIGSGCGLLTMMGSFLVGKTGIAHGLEVRKDIIEFSLENIRRWRTAHPEYDLNISFELRNCFLVDAEERLWDRVHVGACCPESKLNELYRLVKPGGRLVTPYGEKLLLAVKNLDGSVTTTELANVRYGDLIIPSEAEVREAQLKAQSKKRCTIKVPEGPFPVSELKLQDESTSDYRLIVEGKTIFTHKQVLRNCIHFAAMLDSGMRESSSSDLAIEEFSYDQVMAALHVIYTGQCEVTSENAVELLEIADFYKLEWMKCKCEHVLYYNIEIETASPLLSIADRYDAQQLRAACFEFILKNYKEVFATESFSQLDRNLIVEITMEACKRSTLPPSD